MKQDGLQVVLLRNAFYRDGYTRLLFVLLLVFFINVILACTVIYQVTHPPEPQYFATTADGRLINVHPLTDPVVTDDFVLQWSADQIRASFSQDFVHWRQQLQDISESFTPDGWKFFLDAMKQSNNLKTLVSLKMVSDAQLTGAPQIIQKAIVNGHYAWKIEMPILVTYTNLQRSIPLPMKVTVIVLRMPVQDYPQRIAINNFLPELQSNAMEQAVITGGVQ